MEPWLEMKRRKGGKKTYWIRDKRDGVQLSIPAGETEQEAKMHFEQYKIRKDLEKEGYEDKYQDLCDRVFGPTSKDLSKERHN